MLEAVLGTPVTSDRVRPARLPDHEACLVSGESFPVIVHKTGAQAEGVLLSGVSSEDSARLDFYEGGFGYSLRDVTVLFDEGDRPARIYWPPDAVTKAAEGRFDLEHWVAEWGAVHLIAAQDAMAHHGRVSAAEIAGLMPFFRARGWAQARLARDPAPCTLRSGRTRSDLTLHATPRRYDGFFRMGGLDLSHRRFDGDWSKRLDREAFIAFDAALVLPYDPATDRVLLVEQLRYGPIARGDPRPWVLEPIAGLVDAGEDPADAARREAQEEAGLTLGDLHPMARVYASPGYSTEFFHCYLAVTDLSSVTDGVGGLASENEDIYRHVLPFERALSLIDTGEVNAGPLAMMLLWLAVRRDGVRTAQ